MEAEISKSERIELRVSAADKRIFRRAQELSGDRSFSSFIIRVVKQYAEEILANNDRIIASEKDRKIFFDAVFGNSKPNKNLVEAAKRYQSKNTQNLVDEMNWSELIFNSGYKFEPIIGKSYFLYQKDDEVFLSMITPEEWSFKCLGEFKMTTDNIWHKIN